MNFMYKLIYWGTAGTLIGLVFLLILAWLKGHGTA